MALSVSEAATTGDLRQTLEAMRDKLSSDLDHAEPSVAAQLAGQLRQVLKDLALLGPPAAKSKTEEMRERRDQRRLAASTPSSAAKAGGSKRG